MADQLREDFPDASTNRDRILQAGLAEFAAVGYDGAAVNAIAARSGLNKQLIYHYFDNKAGLYQAVLEEYLHTTQPPLDAPDLSTLLDLSQTGPRIEDWKRLLGWEGLQYTGGEIPFLTERQESFGLLRTHIEHLQDTGAVSPELDSDMLTLLISLAVTTPSIVPQLAIAVTGSDPRGDEFRQRMNALLRSILGISTTDR